MHVGSVMCYFREMHQGKVRESLAIWCLHSMNTQACWQAILSPANVQLLRFLHPIPNSPIPNSTIPFYFQIAKQQYSGSTLEDIFTRGFVIVFCHTCLCLFALWRQRIYSYRLRNHTNRKSRTMIVGIAIRASDVCKARVNAIGDETGIPKEMCSAYLADPTSNC